MFDRGTVFYSIKTKDCCKNRAEFDVKIIFTDGTFDFSTLLCNILGTFEHSKDVLIKLMS